MKGCILFGALSALHAALLGTHAVTTPELSAWSVRRLPQACDRPAAAAARASARGGDETADAWAAAGMGPDEDGYVPAWPVGTEQALRQPTRQPARRCASRPHRASAGLAPRPRSVSTGVLPWAPARGPLGSSMRRRGLMGAMEHECSRLPSRLRESLLLGVS